MNRKLGLVLTIMFSLVLSACSKPEPEVSKPAVEAPKAPSGPVYPYPGIDLTADQLTDLGIDGDPRDEKVVYFEYNSTAIDRRSEVILLAHALYLGKRSGSRVSLEGHADERGTRDYNLALGERRAKVVSEVLAAKGSASQNQTISYGEERPVDTAHTEASWQKNRRVEIKY